MFKRYIFVEGLTNLVGSDGKYCINIRGKVKDSFGDDIPTKKDDDGFTIVHVKSWDGLRDYRVIDLVATHFKDLHIPKDNYNEVVAFPLDNDKNHVHAKNVGYRFKSKLEVVNHPGFYYIPAFTRYAINKNGDVLNLKKNILMKWQISKPRKRNIRGGYFSCGYHYYGETSTCSRHRALCLTFKEYPDNVDDMTVNHKNGIPGDDRLDNLEWATRGQNNTHAYVNNLKNQHHRVLARNVISGEVVEHYSISECARQLGYPTDETIRFRLLKCSFGDVFSDGYQFKYKSDVRDWIIPSNPQKAVQDAQTRTAVRVRNCKTMEAFDFDSVMAASTYTGVNSSSIGWRIDRDDQTPLFGYQFKKTQDFRDFPSFTEKEYMESLTPNAFKVECRNHLTGEIRNIDSINLAVAEFGNTNIAAELREGGQPLLPSGWQIKLQGQEWIEFEDFEEEIYKRNKTIVARCEQTGKLIIADSSRKMGEALGKDPKALRKAALTRGNKVYHGYRLRLGLSDDAWPTDSGAGNTTSEIF